MQQMVVEQLMNKWEDVLNYNAPGTATIADKHRKYVTAQLLENTEKEIREAAGYNSTGLLTENNTTGAAISNFDPVMIYYFVSFHQSAPVNLTMILLALS